MWNQSSQHLLVDGRGLLLLLLLLLLFCGRFGCWMVEFVRREMNRWKNERLLLLLVVVVVVTVLVVVR